jgi:hypothetical protein
VYAVGRGRRQDAHLHQSGDGSFKKS